METDFSIVSPTMRSAALGSALAHTSLKMASQAAATVNDAGSTTILSPSASKKTYRSWSRGWAPNGLRYAALTLPRGAQACLQKESEVEASGPLRNHGETVFGQAFQKMAEFTEQRVDIAAKIIRAVRPIDLHERITKRRQDRGRHLRQCEELAPYQRFCKGGKKIRRIEKEPVELVVALAIGTGSEVDSEIDRGFPRFRGIADRRRYVNVPEGNGEQPAKRQSRLRRLADTGRNIPENPHAGVYLSGLVDDSTQLPGGVDSANLREPRIDLLSDPGAGLGIDARPEGADVHTIPSVA